MLYLRGIVPLDLLRKMLEEGYVRKQVHPQYENLWIFNYSEATQFERMWNEVTNLCRGLIVDATDPTDPIVVARPFSKFHNLNTTYMPETMEENLPNEAPLVTTKLDGSMGIVYFYDGQWWVATRGSFDSDQARRATAWYHQHAKMFPQDWPAETTPVCEIIYPENRIVVDYNFEGLVLLSMIDNETGHEFARDEMELWAEVNVLQVVDKFTKSLAECASEDTLNEEGYVLTYSNGVKVKCKFESYVRLHRILTGLNPKSVWEMLSLKQDEAIAALLSDEHMPQSFKTWLSGWVTRLKTQFVEIEAEAKAVFAGKPSGSRKDDALYFTKTVKHLTGVLFKMLDSKDYAEVIFDMIKPKATDTFKVDGE